MKTNLLTVAAVRKPFECQPALNGGWVVYDGNTKHIQHYPPLIALSSDEELIAYLAAQLKVSR